MKLTKAEIVVAALSLALLTFFCGFFLGKDRNRGALVVQTQKTAAADPVVSALPAQSADAAPQEAPDGPVNINTADKETLMALPGIGEVLAQRIIDHRTQFGPFRTADALLDVDGIGEKKLESILSYITVE